MNSLLEFERYLKKGLVKTQTPDKSRSNDLVREATRKFNFLNSVLSKIGLNNDNANDIIEICYDLILNLIRSKMLLKGFSASGKGAHEAEVSYLKKLDFSEAEIRFVNQLRYFRNGILYYGKSFDLEYGKKVVRFMKVVRGRLG